MMGSLEYTERVSKFKEIMGNNVTSDGLLYLIDNGFFTAPASKKYHGNYEGGLFDHSYEVAFCLDELTKKCDLEWKNQRSPLIVGMFHDLCKIDQYQHPEIKIDGFSGEEIIQDEYSWENNPYTIFEGHGDKSIILLSQLMRLTDEEIACIRYHMGAFCEKSEWEFYTRAVKKYPNVLWTHTADMIASHVNGV